MSMAVTGLDCLLPSVQQLHHRPPVIMDKQSFDLNKHAFDLNEAPLSDRGLDLQGATHEFASSLHPKKGGWLEMFNNMFGQDKTMIGSSPFMPCSTMLNTSFINSLSQAEKTVLTDRNIQSNGPGISRTSVSHEGQIVHDGNDVHEDKGAALNGSSELCNQRDAHGKLVLDNEVSHGNSNAHEKLLSTDDVRSNDFSVMGEQYIRVPSLHYLKQPLDANNVNISSFMSTGVPNPKPGLAQWLCTSAAPLDSGVYPCSNAGKASLPPCVLNSQDFPQSSEDFQLSMVPKTSCGTSCQIPYIWVSDTIENGDTSSQLCEGLIINHRQDDATLLLEDQNCKALAVLPKNGKGGRPEMSKALMNRERVLQGKAPRIRIIDSPDWLPTGWTTELKTRMAGSTAGTTDKYYRDPSTGRRFRSKVEVMNFLQTGRRKPKHPVTPLEGTGMPLLLERQDQRVVPFENNQALVRSIYLPPAGDISNHLLLYQDLWPLNLSLERIKSKKEEIPMIQTGLLNTSNDLCKFSNNRTQTGESGLHAERETRELQAIGAMRPHVHNGTGESGLHVERERRELETIEAMRPHVQNGSRKSHSLDGHKRKMEEGSYTKMSPKRFHHAVKELQSKDRWIFCMNSIAKEAEMQKTSRTAGFATETACYSYSGLPSRQDPNGPQDEAVTDFPMARYEVNEKALRLHGTLVNRTVTEHHSSFSKELQPKAVSTSKVIVKKPIKLTLKQERDLLVVLGKKLCVDYTSSGKERSVHQYSSEVVEGTIHEKNAT